jgi:hypothetical protein
MNDKHTSSANNVRLKSRRLVTAITTKDTEQSRQQFASLNVHKTGGVVRLSTSLGPASISGAGADTDIVNTKLTGPADKVISDGGGRRMGGALVYVVFWGDQWLNIPAPGPSMDDVLSDIENILSGPYLDAVAQYDVSVAPGIGYAKFAGAWIEHRATPPYEFTMVDVNYEAWLTMTSGPIPAATNTVVCVIMPPGATPRAALDGQHDRSLQPDLNWVPTMWVKFDTRPNMSAIFSHELVETVTDPDGDGIQIKPASSTDWNEVADVCEDLSYVVLNGVTVASYWSAEDNSCVVPSPVAVEAWQIMCIHKKWGDDNPNENISVVGGIHIPSGERYWMAQTEVITRIENGDSFFVAGTDGSQAKVIVGTHYPSWAPQGSKYITTVNDDSKLDNLLSLPDCGQISDWNP